VGRPSFNEHQSALFAMTQLLDSMTTVASSSLKERIARMILRLVGAVDVVIECADAFLGQARAQRLATIFDRYRLATTGNIGRAH